MRLDSCCFVSFRGSYLLGFCEALCRLAKTCCIPGSGSLGFNFTVAPLLWNPVPGAEFLLVSGRSGENLSFVVAFYVIGENEYRLASSFLMRNEPGPVAFAYDNSIRPRLHFSTCWGCGGEGGAIQLGADGRVHIVQR